jgi:two-component system cell cycle response regulator DivK
MPTCLVVEDHGDTREGYAEFLSYAGFKVMSAAGRDEMQRHLADVIPDAVVMDLQLPEVDGWALIRELKASARTRDVPVLVVSAAVRDSDKASAFEAGCDAFLPKPADPDDIVAELGRLMAVRKRGRTE